MKTKQVFGILSFIICAFCICGCNDDFNPFPEEASFLRMTNEDNGKVLLGNSDVYITNAGNFKSEIFPIFDMGKKQGINDIGMPNFVNMAPEVAVQPKHGYVICSPDDIRTFKSRKKAIREDSDMYRVFADSWIKDETGTAVGANVYFVLGKPLQDENSKMPKWGTEIGGLEWDFYEEQSTEITLSLPSDDIEVSFDDYNSADIISYSIKDNTVSFYLLKGAIYNIEYYTHKIFIRHKNVYTMVLINLNV